MTKPHVAAEFLSAPGWNRLYSKIGMNTKNVLEQLQSLDSSQSRVEGAVNSLKERLIHLENEQGSLIQKMTILNAARAQRQSLVVALGKRLDRVELCLPNASISATTMAPIATLMLGDGTLDLEVPGGT